MGLIILFGIHRLVSVVKLNRSNQSCDEIYWLMEAHEPNSSFRKYFVRFAVLHCFYPVSNNAVSAERAGSNR